MIYLCKKYSLSIVNDYLSRREYCSFGSDTGYRKIKISGDKTRVRSFINSSKLVKPQCHHVGTNGLTGFYISPAIIGYMPCSINQIQRIYNI
jgi:hypothetical protein